MEDEDLEVSSYPTRRSLTPLLSYKTTSSGNRPSCRAKQYQKPLNFFVCLVLLLFKIENLFFILIKAQKERERQRERHE